MSDIVIVDIFTFFLFLTGLKAIHFLLFYINVLTEKTVKNKTNLFIAVPNSVLCSLSKECVPNITTEIFLMFTVWNYCHAFKVTRPNNNRNIKVFISQLITTLLEAQNNFSTVLISDFVAME